MNLANRFTEGRVVSVLEGGYNLDVLPLLVENHIKMLAAIR
jgi:acetoin utilization deacetylase AcuC-like enzyme